jgi:radical SAM family uncharacterized protein
MDINEFLFELQNPQVYTGREINVVRRPFRPDNLNVCLLFPDTYEIGMSNQGLKLLYHQLNASPGVNAERCFLPQRDNLARFARTPLFSLENRVGLDRFDMIGFSLLSELNFTNVLLALQLAGLAVRSADRPAAWPLIGAGGIASANPEPLRDFIDFFAIGDGEVLFPDLLEQMAAAKRAGTPKSRLLADLDALAGVYVPALHETRRNGLFFVPEMGGKTVRKRVLPGLERAVPQAAEIVPIGDVVFNRLNVEIARGCPQTCRFCQAKQYYAPLRNRELEPITAYVRDSLARTGYQTFSLASLSAGDHPRLAEMLQAIPSLIRPDIAFSLPSLRPSTLKENVLATLAQFRRTGITIVPEAGSERLRRAINKNVRDEEIFQAVEFALLYRWQKLKLYFMIGLPGEEPGEVEAIVRLIARVRELARGRRQRLDLHVSFSSFVPKPHTPLQWAARQDLERLLDTISRLRGHLKPWRDVQADYHSPHRGVVETVLSRGDSRVGRLLEGALDGGEAFTAWENEFHPPVWDRLLDEHDGRVFLDEIPTTAELPWGFVELNYRRDHLLAEYDRSRAADPVATPACGEADCRTCRGCLFPAAVRPDSPSDPFPVPPPATPAVPGRYRRMRLFYEKSGDYRFFSHLAMSQQLERLLRRSGLQFAFSGGFHPRMRMVSLPPLPVHAEGLDEVAELSVQDGLTENEVLHLLQLAADGFPIRRVHFLDQEAGLGRDLRFVTYEFLAPCPDETLAAVRGHLLEGEEMDTLPVGVRLRIDYGRDGPARFGRIYRLLDPDKQKTRHLRRLRVEFASAG